MLKTGMLGRRIGVVGESELLDPAQSLEVWVFNYIKDPCIGNCDKSIHRIVDILLFIGNEQNR